MVEQRQKPRPPQPMGPLMKGAQKAVVIVFYVVGIMLVLGAIRNITVMYRDWLYWVMLIVLVFFMVCLFPVLKDVLRSFKN